MKKILFPAFLLLSACGTSAIDRSAITEKHPSQIVSAYSYYGWSEKTHRQKLEELVGVDPVEIEWCAAFVNAILTKEGIEGSDTVSEFPLTAKSFMLWGEEVKTPQSGDIIVFPRGEPWQGHVGFYVRTKVIDGVPNYLILGGNQDDSVNLSFYPASTALSIRRRLPQSL